MPKEPDTEAELKAAADRLAQRQAEMLKQIPRLTTIELAEEAGVSRSTVNRYPAALEHLEQLKNESKLVLPQHLTDAKRAASEKVKELERKIEVLAHRVFLLTEDLQIARENPGARGVISIKARRDDDE